MLAQITGLTYPGSVFTNYNLFASTLVTRILVIAIFIAGFIFLIRIIASGFTLLTAAGDPGKIQSATKGLTHGLIGLVIVVSAFFIAQIIQYIFGLRIL